MAVRSPIRDPSPRISSLVPVSSCSSVQLSPKRTSKNAIFVVIQSQPRNSDLVFLSRFGGQQMIGNRTWLRTAKLGDPTSRRIVSRHSFASLTANLEQRADHWQSVPPMPYC